MVDAELRDEKLLEEPWVALRARLSSCRFADAEDPLQAELRHLEVPTDRRLPSAWADFFDIYLQRLGWPGDSLLQSRQYQAQVRFQEQMGAMAGFDQLLGPMTVSEAVRRLWRLTSTAVFQPRSRNAPVQIMGVLEALGQQFQHLWVGDMCEDSWPGPVRPAAFIPLNLQRRAGIVDAVAELHAIDIERITNALMHLSPEITVSYTKMDGDRERLPCPLTMALPLSETLPGLPPPAVRLRSVADVELEPYFDWKAPPLAEAVYTSGGTSVFTMQARCPFQAFARLRLSAAPLARPEHGIRPVDRGALLHDCLERVWASLQSHAGLLASDSESVVSTAVKEAFASSRALRNGRIPAQMLQAERHCIAYIIQDMLELERQRIPFRVESIEEASSITIGGLTVKVRIDRIDRLVDGTLAVIDYKISRKAIKDWMSDRPLEPQLPLYAIALRKQVSSIAFATVKRSACRFTGLTASESGFTQLEDIGKVKDETEEVLTWDGLIQSWEDVLSRLAKSFREGDARVDPRDGSDTCDFCDLQPLCRIDTTILRFEENEEAVDDGE